MRTARHTSAALRRGFTAIELMMGLAITTLVMTALAAVVAAVGQGWRATELTQMGAVGESGAMSRISRTLREARAVGTPRTFSDGSAGLMIWEEDAGDGGKPLISEMATLEFNAPSRQVRLISMRTTRYDLLSGLADLLQGDLISLLKGLIGSLFGGQPEVESRVLAERVKSAEFRVIPPATAGAGQLPRVEFTLEFERPIPGKSGKTHKQTHYGSATLRSPLE